jgi:hypothetical protein
MLTETVEVPATRSPEDLHAAPRAAADRIDGAEIAAHEARTARIENALLAIEALGRRRRAHELVEAIERLGAGLTSTSDALDDALGAVVAAHEDSASPAQAPLPAILDWTPISAPVAPIAPFVAAPEAGSAPVHVAAVVPPAPAPAAPALPAPVRSAGAPASLATRRTADSPARFAPAVADEPAAEDEQGRRRAPAGLAAFVIDFSAR